MRRVLHLSTSLDLQHSTSRAIGGLLICALKEVRPGLFIARRDLAKNPLPHVEPGFFESLAAPEAEAMSLSRELVDELRGADLLVIESPMYNFSIPSTLKAWIDHIVRADLTFKVTGNVREGLLGATKAILILSSGGVYAEGPAAGLDHQEPYLRTILGYVGITDIDTIKIDGTAWGEEKKHASLRNARVRVGEVAARFTAV